jgi:tellurite resistance protein
MGWCVTSCDIKNVLDIRPNWCQVKFFAKRNVEQGVLKVCYYVSSRRGQQTNNALSLSISFCQMVCGVSLDSNRIA